jgi:Rad3-related DNA helicase
LGATQISDTVSTPAADEAAYLHLCTDGAGTRVAATGACHASVAWRSTARPGEIDGQLLSLVEELDADRVMVYDARLPAALLSQESIAHATSSLRTRLRDVMAGVLLLCPTLRDLSLPAVARELGVADEDTPAIISDPAEGAELCHRVVGALHRRLGRMPAPVLALIRELLASDADLAWLQVDAIEMPALEAAALEMLLAARPGAPALRRRERLPMEAPLPGVAAGLLGEDGPVATALERYEHRPGQIEMAEGVGSALEDGEILMVEAGTGVGKSLAYLVPAILWSRANAQPVIVSTNTKNLQEQLIEKDLPLLRESLGIEFHSALLKGRTNYVCVRRFVSQIRDAMLSMMPDDRKAAAFLVSWFAASRSADLDMIPAEATAVFPGLGRLIGQVRSDRVTCLGRGCEHATRCPLRVARATARNADVVVSNHALTLADTQFDVLPEAGRVIFDEAHNLENVATDQLGYEVSNFSFRELRRTVAGGSRNQGFLGSLANRLPETSAEKAAGISEARARLSAAAEAMDGAGEALGAAVIDLCVALDSEAGAGRARIRLDGNVYATGQWQSVGEAVAAVRRRLDTAAAALGEIAETMAEGAERGTPESDIALEAAGARVQVAELSSALGTVMDDEAGAGYVLWAETVRRRWGELWRLAAAPIDVGPALQRAVYDRRDCVIMTSATLTVDGSFAYMKQRLGLDGPDAVPREQVVPSPFHYPEQLLLCVPHDIPTRGEEGREEALAGALLDIAETAGGGVLLLFTSRAQMDRTFNAIRGRLADIDLSPVCQYTSGPRNWLLQQLRERENTVLFGLKSFWEGVDVPGQALRCVVITKLPFAVPTDPIVQSRCELADRRRADGGSDYYIPETILAFKQGFGRLVRSATDSGVVFVLDNRIITRRYGQRFFASIPDCRIVVEPFHECLVEAERWLRRS